MRAPNPLTAITLLLPLLASALPQEPASPTSTQTSTSTMTITHTLLLGTQTLTSVYLSATPVPITVSELSYASSSSSTSNPYPEISAPKGSFDATSRLIYATQPASTVKSIATAASSDTVALSPSATGSPQPFTGKASGRLDCGMWGLGLAMGAALVVVGGLV